MARRIRKFKVELLTPDARVCNVRASGVTFPASDGQMGVLAGRAPLVARMGAGAVVIDMSSNDTQEYFASGGFAHVHEDGLTILAEECVPMVQLDPEKAWDELQKARRLPSETAREIEIRESAVSAAQEKFRLAQKFRKKQRAEMGL
jgi:F-type H+-transporting ATPase subunit epsilon